MPADPMTLAEAWDAIPPDTWIALKRTHGALLGHGPRYSYYCEIGHAGEWRTGEIAGGTVVHAVNLACARARELIADAPNRAAVQRWHGLNRLCREAVLRGDMDGARTVATTADEVAKAYPEAIRAECDRLGISHERP